METNVLKSQVQEQYLNLVGLDGLTGAVSVERKNQRVKYKTHRVTGGEMLKKKMSGVEQGLWPVGKENNILATLQI